MKSLENYNVNETNENLNFVEETQRRILVALLERLWSLIKLIHSIQTTEWCRSVLHTLAVQFRNFVENHGVKQILQDKNLALKIPDYIFMAFFNLIVVLNQIDLPQLNSTEI